jgi:hypothetical protein
MPAAAQILPIETGGNITIPIFRVQTNRLGSPEWVHEKRLSVADSSPAVRTGDAYSDR